MTALISPLIVVINQSGIILDINLPFRHFYEEIYYVEAFNCGGMNAGF